jgi:DNA polymerase
MLDARRRVLLEAMGIDVWLGRQSGPMPLVETGAGAGVRGPTNAAPANPLALETSRPAHRVSHVPRVPEPGPSDTSHLDPRTPALDPRISTLNWAQLRAAVQTCTDCQLHQARTQTVFGVGSESAELMIVGEAPGAEEDRQGEPFVGRAGQLLNAMLAAIGLDRQQVYIANIIKCRPPGNRDPHRDEADACRGYLLRQIELIRPKVLLSVGRVSAHNLLGCEDPVGRLRGRPHRFEPGDIPLIVTYHPAYLLRRPEEKAKAWADLQVVARQLATA